MTCKTSYEKYLSTDFCVSVKCGDGTLDAGEECDDSNRDDNDGCTFECKLEKC